jgi:TonB family protein
MKLPGVLLASSLAVASLVAGPAWPQAAEEPARMAGSDVPAPKRTKFVAPEYPADAQARGLRGIVILELIIDTQGKVASATVTRSVPPFDDAALAAVRRWEYEVTRVGGKAVPVRLSVPITFTMPVPRVTRQTGIPELVQGVNPLFPAGQDRAASVVAELTLEPTGQVVEIEIKSGETAFADALLAALRTWRFAPEGNGGTVSFRVEADFVPAKGGSPRVEVRLAGLRRSETAANAPPSPEPSPAAPPEPAPAPEAGAPSAVPASPAPSPPPAPAPAATPAPHPAPATVAPSGPPVETLGPAPAPAMPQVAPPLPAPTPPPEVPVSAVRDVALAAGVPDLLRGRRPVVPPLARMASTTGTVEVRFAVDAAGTSSVQDVTGPELLKEAARQAVASWVFRRTTADRLRLAASFVYGAATANATVRREE